MKFYNIIRTLLTFFICLSILEVTLSQSESNPYNPYYSNDIKGYIGALIQSSKTEKGAFDILLEKWGLEEIRSTLIQECREKSGSDLVFRLKLLGELYDSSLVPFIQEFLNAPDFRLRNAVATVIARRGYPSAAPLIGDYLLRNKIDQTTFFMIHSLEMIATKEALQYLEELDQSDLGENKFFSSQIDRAITVVKKYIDADSKKSLLEQYLRPDSRREDFYWAVKKIYQKPEPIISLDYVNRMFIEIGNKDQIASSVLTPNYNLAKSEEQIFQETGYFIALLKLRKHLGGILDENEEIILEKVIEHCH